VLSKRYAVDHLNVLSDELPKFDVCFGNSAYSISKRHVWSSFRANGTLAEELNFGIGGQIVIDNILWDVRDDSKVSNFQPNEATKLGTMAE
jgi:hypothetical protein